MALNVLQLSQIRKRIRIHGLECMAGGFLGALGALILIRILW